MKLALFSQEVTDKHIERLKTFFNKHLEEVRFLYINTPGNYKPYKSKWMIESENRWRAIFPDFQEFEIERALRIDPNFDFAAFYSNYDFIFVGGGTVYILTYWMKKTKSREIIRKMILKDGIVYGGESAGAIFTYKDMDYYKLLDHPERAPEKIDEGLSVVDFAPIPHWENEEFHEGLSTIKDNFESQGVNTYPITDSEALFVHDSDILRL
jgi:hypothetical protein